MVNKKEIIYPKFLECCKFAEDIFWKNIFEDMAYGKCIPSTYISNEVLYCSYKDKNFSYVISNKEPNILYYDIYKLLNKKLGILSYKDKVQKKIKFFETEEKIRKSRISWNDIKKKNLKELLIELYILDLKKKYNLTMKQCKYLAYILNIAIIFKVIGSKDIIYKDGKIVKINGINIKNKEIIITKEIYNMKINFSPEIIINKKLMSEKWETFLENFRKN